MKNFIDKILDVPKLIRRIWLMLWVILVILLVLKFCFNQWYPIVVRNEVFISVCNFIDNNKWLELTIMFILYIININVITLTCTNKKKYKNWLELLIVNIIILGNFVVKYFNSILGNIGEILMIISYIIINIKYNRFNNKITNIILPIIFYIAINVWQLTIFLIRGLNINELNTFPVLIPYILQIDYYIFLLITWIGVCFMGLYGMGWLWCKSSTELKAMREIELAKKNPNEKLIAKIDERITKLEKEGK